MGSTSLLNSSLSKMAHISLHLFRDIFCIIILLLVLLSQINGSEVSTTFKPFFNHPFPGRPDNFNHNNHNSCNYCYSYINKYSGWQACFPKLPYCPDINGEANAERVNPFVDDVANYRPSIKLYCSAGYPIGWLLHFDERDNPEAYDMNMEVIRNGNPVEDPSTYTYKAIFKITYPQKIQYFPNFTCQAVSNSSISKRVVIFGNDTLFSAIRLTTPNDHIIARNNSSTCHKYVVFEDLSPFPSIVRERGDCAICMDINKEEQTYVESSAVPAKYYSCHNPFICRSIYGHLQNNLNCYSSTPRDIREGGLCADRPTLRPFVVFCKPALGEVDVAQVGFYSVRQAAKENLNTFKRGRAPVPYFQWSDVEPEDMVQLILHTNLSNPLFVRQSISFTCMVSTYYCAHDSKMGIQWNRGNISFHPEEWKHTFDENGVYEQYYRIDLNRSGNLTLSCFAPVINSSEWISHNITVQVHQIEQPEIVYLGYSSEVEGGKAKVGTEDLYLICSFLGKPISSVSWIFNNGSTLPAGTYKSTTGNTSSLHLPNIFPELAGSYTCRVETFFGAEAKAFMLEVEEIHTSSSHILITILSLAFLMLTVFGFVLYRFWRINLRQQEVIRRLTESEYIKFRQGANVDNLPDQDNPNANIESLPYDSRLEINYEKLQIDFDKILGCGEFGLVYKGQITSGATSEADYLNVDEGSLLVAVKTVNDNVSVDYFMALLSEIKLMAYVGENKNVVKLFGACTEDIRDRKVYIVLEYCQEGSLLSYLKQNRSKFHNLVEYGIIKESLVKIYDKAVGIDQHDTKRLLLWSLDIANGLQHIHEKKVVHGDLAARNVLLSSSFVAKVSDFGLSRQLAECGNYVKTTQVPLPWKYMAPESLTDRVFSTKSDVWAFGVTLWEMFSLGEIPYGGLTWSTGFMDDLRCGVRLNKPKYATNEIYEYMLKSWEGEPWDRPQANELLGLCQKHINQLAKVETSLRNNKPN